MLIRMGGRKGRSGSPRRLHTQVPASRKVEDKELERRVTACLKNMQRRLRRGEVVE